MPFIVKCPNAACGKQMQVPDNAAGKRVQCPTCKQPFQVPAAQPTPLTPVSSPSISLGDSGINLKPSAAPTKCPACGSTLNEGAVACMDCGFMLQADTGPAEPEGPPNLCANPACGVANPPGERNCQRCGNPLPIAGGTLLHGRYRLEKLLKMGGFGAVYRGTDTKQADRPVAIKDMIGNDPQEFAIRLNFFRREAEILRALEKVPIVPRVYDFIHQGQTAHLVMEFIKGKDLLDIMEQNANKPFPIPLVVEWGKAVCEVLQTMHNQSPPLIHRDLKPDNIMLLEDQRSIKMIDFGTARDLGRTAKERAAGKTRAYTEGYAPPEQIVGKPEARSDLFALAATLYHLITGKAPEGFYTAKEIETQLSDSASTIPAQYRWFYDLIRINLSEDVNDRYFSAKEMKADLDAQRVTKESPCPKCQTPNKVRTPFCVKCAEPLTDPTAPCVMCGKYNRMGGRFCIYCGNRLRSFLPSPSGRGAGGEGVCIGTHEDNMPFVVDGVPESALDNDEIMRRGGANCGDEDFALCKCPHCGRVYLLEYEVATIYLDPGDLHQREDLFNITHFRCEGCDGVFPKCAWIGSNALAEMQVIWDDLAASPWRWVTEQTRNNGGAEAAHDRQ